MNRSDAFHERLRGSQILVADGAAGTVLQAMGLPTGTAPEAYLLERPDLIRSLHQGYVDAGSDLILTCTFGGTRYRLSNHGLAGQVVSINRKAAELAREVAGESVLVAGDMGPSGQLLSPLGTASEDDLIDAFTEQAQGLVEGGVDFLLIETMSDLGEAKAAIEGARRASDLPLVCSFSFDTHGRTMMGLTPEMAAREVAGLVDGVGANCGRDPAEYPAFVEAMRQAAPQTIIWAKPNAGLPQMVKGEMVYEASGQYMADVALQLRDAGARVIGGCCGTTASHISAMAAALKR
jgi:5-methyltetrahydrofolate--homocysteine methyltransferase